MYVLTKYLLQSLLKRSDFTGRIVKWGTRLESLDIKYRPRISVKGQVLADFVAKFTPTKKGPSGIYNVSVQSWRVFVDSASNAQGAEIGIVIMSPEA